MNRYCTVDGKAFVGILTVFGPEGFEVKGIGPHPRSAAEAFALRADGEVLGHRWTIPFHSRDTEAVHELLLLPARAWFHHVAPLPGFGMRVDVPPWPDWADLHGASQSATAPLGIHRAVFGDRLLLFTQTSTRNFELKDACERAMTPRGMPYTSTPLQPATEDGMDA